MKYALIAGAALMVSATAQDRPLRENAPIYRITVVERTTKAVNYEYRTGPTRIDFRGTVLLPKAKGDAIVESKRGRTEIDVHFHNVNEPSRFGREYLTYVLWALTADGRPHNLGEVVANGSDNAHLHVTTDLQAFAMIVTAEPYSAVRRPGDVVVLENEVRPDTVGKVVEVNAKYELLPRGHYSWERPANLNAPPTGPKVSMRKYEELLEIYQAQNAIGIARTANAQEIAPNTFAKAEQLLAEAQRWEREKGDHTTQIIQAARESAQTAEDARVIAERRAYDDKLAKAQGEISAAQQARARAEAEAQEARDRAQSAQAEIDAERAARRRAEAEAAAARAASIQSEGPPQQAAVVIETPATTGPDQDSARKSATRMRLLEQCNGIVSTRDTPRGLVATIPDSSFNGAVLRAPTQEQLVRISTLVVRQPGLRVEVEGHTDSPGTEALSRERAEAARQVLVQHGLPASVVTARGLGNTRPLTSSATETRRLENQRVEIIIVGDPIGKLPFWDRPYALK